MVHPYVYHSGWLTYGAQSRKYIQRNETNQQKWDKGKKNEAVVEINLNMHGNGVLSSNLANGSYKKWEILTRGFERGYS